MENHYVLQLFFIHFIGKSQFFEDIYIDGLKLRMSRFFPIVFTQKIEPDPFRGVLGAT